MVRGVGHHPFQGPQAHTEVVGDILLRQPGARTLRLQGQPGDGRTTVRLLSARQLHRHLREVGPEVDDLLLEPEAVTHPGIPGRVVFGGVHGLDDATDLVSLTVGPGRGRAGVVGVGRVHAPTTHGGIRLEPPAIKNLGRPPMALAAQKMCASRSMAITGPGIARLGFSIGSDEGQKNLDGPVSFLRLSMRPSGDSRADSRGSTPQAHP